MNPYEVGRADSSLELDSNLACESRAKARRLAAAGSVVGSISKKLQSDGIDPAHAYEIATDAVIAQSRRERFAGLGLISAGMILMSVGGLLLLFFDVRVAIGFVIFSGFVLMLGLYKLFHRSKLNRRWPR